MSSAKRDSTVHPAPYERSGQPCDLDIFANQKHWQKSLSLPKRASKQTGQVIRTTFFKGNDTRHNLQKLQLFMRNTIKEPGESHNHSLQHTKVGRSFLFLKKIRYFALFMRRPARCAGHPRRWMIVEETLVWTCRLSAYIGNEQSTLLLTSYKEG